VLTLPKYLVITVVLYSGLLTLAMMVTGRRMVRVIAGKNRPRRNSARSPPICVKAVPIRRGERRPGIAR
jgi:hypothetical protein